METTEKKSVSAKKVLGVIANVLMWIFIAFSIVITIFAFSAQSNEDGVPTIGKDIVMSPVLSNSMADKINEGDIIFSHKLSEDEKTKLSVGDIITFKVDLDNDGTPEINTHRIVEVIPGGFVSYRTKGDNNEIADTYTVNAVDVISKFELGKDTRIPRLGYVIKFLLEPTGFFIVIVIPLILFFLFEIIMFVRKVMEVKNAGKKQITAEDEELIKQRAIEEYLRQQQQAESEKSGESPEEPNE